MLPKPARVLVSPALLILTAVLASGRTPNVVVFLVDDLGWNDSSVDLGLPKAPGLNSHHRTPGLERLAREGTRFSQAYATPVCTPSRVSLLTGLSAVRHGVTNWTLAPGKEIGAKVGGLSMPDWNCDGLQPVGSGARRGFETKATLPALLREAGYRTILVGKAHFGARDTPGADPRRLGFDVSIGGSAAAQPGSYSGRSNFSDRRPGKEFWDVPDLAEFHGKDITLTQALTDKAIAEIRRAATDGKPFYLHLAHYGVHTPIEAAKEFAADYRDLDLPPRERDYATMVADVDLSLRRILEALDRHGLDKDTVVIFLSDNGGFVQRSGAYAPRNSPLRGGKGSAYDGGLRTPMVVRWPGVARPGALTRELASIEDLLPTCLAAAGIEAPEGLDGRDLSPVLRGGTRPARDLLWHYPHVWGVKGPGVEPFSAIRRGNLKAIHFLIDGRTELYDVAADPGESADLAGARAEEAGRLRDALLAALRSAGRELPRR